MAPAPSARPTLSAIVPTIGRPTLARTLRALARQLEPGDEAIVVGDGPQPRARTIFDAHARPSWRYFEHGPTNAWGAAQREFAIERAAGEVLCFVDDDDVHARAGIDAIRRGAAEHPGRPLLFRMDWYGTTLWRRPAVEPRNVGTPIFVVPNDRERMAPWGEGYLGDFEFIAGTIERHGGVVWREELVVHCRPQRLRRARRAARRAASGVRQRLR
jgi:glycosyltransferase involved in cell wall biosynthesis